MANVNFEIAKSKKSDEFKPIQLSDGSVVKMQWDLDGENVSIRGTIEKNGKEIGRISWSTEFNRLTVSISPLDALESSVALEAVDVFTAGLHNVLDNKD